MRRSWFGAAVLILGASVAIAAGQDRQAAATSDMDDAKLLRDGKAATATVCSGCHDIDSIYTARKTQHQWDEVVVDMATRGAEGNTAQFALIKRYLTRTYGVVAVNTAPAAEIAAVLGLGAKDAAAIVAYRTANGEFADRAALAKVEGIDQKKLDEQPEALRFRK